MRERGPRGRAPARRDVERVYGVAAALAVLDRRPEDVVRIAYTEAVRRPLAHALRMAARRRIAYQELDDDALSELAGAAHHEGICVVAYPRIGPPLAALGERVGEGDVLVALDGVDNPHNVGAVLRSAAFFGAAGLIVADPARRSLPPSAVRIAEGGAEVVPVAFVPALAPALTVLRGQGLTVVGTDSHAGIALRALPWPVRTVLVLGSERHGMSSAVRRECTVVAHIGGDGAVDSLNVSVAAGVLLASHDASRPV